MTRGDISMTRGSWIASAGRARKGLTLTWAALFVCSLLLQTAVLAAPSGATAAGGLKADTVQGFEVDGNLKSEAAATPRASCPPARVGPACTPTALVDSPPMSNGVDWLDGTSVQGVVDPATPPASAIINDP